MVVKLIKVSEFAQRLTTGKDLVVLENGTILVGSDEFRRVHAYREDGTVLINKEHAFSNEHVIERRQLTKSGFIPGEGDVQQINASLEEIANAYNARPRITTSEAFLADRGMADRLYDIFDRAAELRAQDVKIYVRAHSTELRLMAAGREFNFKGLSSKKDGDEAISFLMHNREEGSGNSNRIDRTFQSFSITSREDFRLPSSIKKLRAQKGYHDTPEDIEDHLVLRLAYAQDHKDTGSLEDLGFDEEVLRALAYMRRKSDGACIVGGKTGDGKTTTLVRCIEELHKERDGAIGIASIEDPVEIQINLPGIVQIPIQSTGKGDERSDNYSEALNHFVRIHPFFGLISEIRNKEAAAQVLQFVSSGHGAYTTLHVRTAIEIPFRLISWGIPPNELAAPDMLRVLMKQNLIQVLCPHCAIDDTLEEFERDTGLRGVNPSVINKRRNHEGCSHCLKTGGQQEQMIWGGYKRLIAVGEVIIVDDEFCLHIQNNDQQAAKRDWLKPRKEGGMGGKTIGQKLIAMSQRGEIDPRDGILIGLDDHIVKRVRGVV
jgi:type II secretory ATPase GspE/PulE/Tfp pilus assembly ATPase PilB-like protein